MLSDQRGKARLAACVMSQFRLFKIEFGTKQDPNRGQAHGNGIALFRFRTRKPGRQRGEILLLVSEWHNRMGGLEERGLPSNLRATEMEVAGMD